MRRISLAASLLAAVIGCATANQACAVALSSFSGTGEPTDLINNPLDFYAFDSDVITWKMDSTFRSFFPSEALRDQVRLSFDEWSTASSDPLRRNTNTLYSWVRTDDSRPVWDLRSVVTHEVGHALGAQHTDASWFNANRQKNFQPDGSGGWIAAAPLGGEIMNEGNGPGLPGAKPAAGMGQGDVWRILSKDEVAMLDYVYDRPLAFQEVGANDPAQIILTISNQGGAPSTNLGAAGPDGGAARDPGNPFAGAQTTTATVFLNGGNTGAMGIDPLTLAWETTNTTGETIRRLSVTTTGTDNVTPIDSDTSGTNRFTTLTTSKFPLATNLQSLVHEFFNAQGGDVPAGGTMRVSLTQDVWDWFTTGAVAQATDGSVYLLPLSSIAPWTEYGLTAGPAEPTPVGLDALPRGPFIAGGFTLHQSDTPGVLVELVLADVSGLGFSGEDLSTETMLTLSLDGKLIRLPVSALTLAGDEILYVLLEGDLSDLPESITDIYRVLTFDIPGLIGAELFVGAHLLGGGFDTWSFALLNEPPFVGRSAVDAPGGLLLFGPWALYFLLRCRRSRSCVS